MTQHLRTIFMGTPDFAVPTLETLATHTQLQMVVSQPDRKRGRGKKVQFSPVKARALALGIDVITPSVVKGKRFASKLAEYAPDVLVTAAFGRILGPSLLAVPRHGCLNVHASLLPKLRGAAPINWAIINGDAETGVSIMRTVPQLDAGDVFRVAKVSILRQTAGELTVQLAEIGALTLLETLRDIDSIVPTPQDESQATFAPMMSKLDGKIDWSKSASAIDCQVRGMNPWPGAFTGWNDEVVKVHAVTVVSDSPGERYSRPGTVVRHSRDGVDVVCGEGMVRIAELQMPGKKRLSAEQFYAGLKFTPGGTFQ
ncbi:MAG: methionyl-tRNA formyltransferase [Deltaproteobacteria bacterium]|nr:methionyl-tRNA formyltransferase [Deltaproteobacteria bacterium]MBN2673257.1 methionyl-tRNA formyltransferase [Deltaproteobacteria bacterium]